MLKLLFILLLVFGVYSWTIFGDDNIVQTNFDPIDNEIRNNLMIYEKERCYHTIGNVTLLFEIIKVKELFEAVEKKPMNIVKMKIVSFEPPFNLSQVLNVNMCRKYLIN